MGSHTLKWGVEVHRYRSDVYSSFLKSGIWSFNSLENFLQGGPTGTSLRIALPGSDNQRAFRQTLLGMYIQDAYQVTPGFQIHIGLRYEFATLIHDKNGRDVYFPDPVYGAEVRVGRLLENNPGQFNFAPRLGVNWSPGNSQTTVLSAGWGIYYDQILVNFAEGTKSTTPLYKSAVRTNFDSSGTFPDAVAAGAGVPHEVQAFDYTGASNPMVLRYNFAIQQEIPGGWRIRASYVGARGNHLIRSYEANLYPVPITLPDGSLFFPPDSGPINPAFAAIEINATDAQSFYNSFQFSANKSLGRGTAVQTSYTYGKSVDDASFQTSDDLFQFPMRRTLDRGLSDSDIRHRLVTNFLYTPPLGSGQRWLNSGVLARIFGGWRLGGIVSFCTGTPFSVRSSVRTPGYLFSATRPNRISPERNDLTRGVTAGCLGSVAPGQELGGVDLYFDPCAFDVPPPGRLGNAGRNILTGPRAINMDISIQREFALDSQRRLSFRAELFNLPNHTNFGSASNRIFTGTTARPRVSSTAGKIRSTSTTARQVQFALRFAF